MQKYFIELYKYSEAGALEAHPFQTTTASDEVQLRAIRDKYSYVYQTKEDGSTGFKAYKVIAYRLGYVKVDDIDTEINRCFNS